MELKDIFFRFKETRKFQDQLMLDIGNAIEQRKHILCHAPLGTGKTDASLSPAISFALKENKTVFFLTPKISQHEIAVQVIKDLSEKFKLDLKAVDLVGRRYMCVDPLLSAADFDGFYEICARRRRKEQCPFYANFPGYSKKEKSVAWLYFEEFQSSCKNVLSHHKVRDYCANCSGAEGERPMCAYEVSLKLAKECSVVVCDYLHLFSPSIQEVILSKTGKSLENSVLIVDEAHNLPDRVRKLMSSSLSTFVLRKAQEEAEKLNQEKIRKNLKNIEKIIKGLGKLHVSPDKREALVSKDKFFAPLLSEVNDLDEFNSFLLDLGIEFMEAANKSKSYLGKVANFLNYWQKDLEAHVRIIRLWPNNADFSLLYNALDSGLITRKIFDSAYSTVLMSGTLLPTEMYADLLGLDKERTIHKQYPSPFPIENRINLVVPTVTTKYTERKIEEFQKIAEKVAGIVNCIPGNSAVFFPSFKLLDAIHPFLADLVSRPILRQKEKMSSAERASLLQQFRNSGQGFGAVMLAASGGSFAEGIDLPGQQLLGVVIVGIPLQEMNLELKCLIDYFDEKFARGWHYAYLYPAINRALQAAGRVIRSPTDEGVIAFLDKRYTWQNYKNCFPKSFNALTTDEPEKYIKTFWQRG